MARPLRPMNTTPQRRRSPDSGRHERNARRPGSSLFGRKPARVSHTPPPVLVRNEAIGIPSQPRKKSVKNRRRYDVALSVPGAEVRLPSLPAFGFSWRILSALIAICLAGLLYYVWTSSTFRVEAPKIEGIQRLTENDINTVVNISGQPIFGISPTEIRQNLQAAFPDTSAITVEVKLPAQVVISIAERQPLLDWKEGDQEKWVDAEGIAFPPRGAASSLIRVTGPNPDTPAETASAEKTIKSDQPVRFVSPQLMAAILTLSKDVPDGNPIVYDNVHGLGWSDDRGWQVYFGTDLSNMDVKLKVYQALLDRLMQDGIQPVLVSVEHVHAPYYRVER